MPTLEQIVSLIEAYCQHTDRADSLLFEAYTSDRRAVRFQVSRPNENMLDLNREIQKTYQS